jgi:hypothetical protein
MLDLAKRNLREYFSVVGLMERFNERLILLKRTFGWRAILYRKRNVGLNPPDTASVDEQTLKAIKDANRLDIELYDYEGVLFREQLRDRGKGVQAGQWAARRTIVFPPDLK